MKGPRSFRGAFATIAVSGGLLLAGCGEEDAVNEAQDEIQRQAEDLTQGIPDEAQDIQQQAEDAAQGVQDQIDDLTNDGGN
jgi:outer membrane murein-binding lipoprotein Lpp